MAAYTEPVEIDLIVYHIHLRRHVAKMCLYNCCVCGELANPELYASVNKKLADLHYGSPDILAFLNSE